ncbi:carboxymuconolactone decarboxylase family protein [Flagellimonas flava]|uniref:carboxymuconolactone decarboxylase family protein n=1 Tax=Flagellimonas flava TaxID=570519 RepID=UPI003D647B02
METRIQVGETEPKAYQAVFGLEGYLAQSELKKSHYKLIKVRASQINGCAFCIDMHTKEALKLGETQERLFLLDAWRDIDVFSEEEKVILQMTEEVTKIHEKGLTPETYQKAIKFFDAHYFSQIIMAIATINVWNRIAISTHMPVPK